MDDATSTIERRRRQSREAQRRFRERKRQSQNQNQSNDITWSQLHENASSSSRLPMEHAPSAATAATLHDSMMAFDFPTTSAVFNSVVIPTTWHGDSSSMTAYASARDPAKTGSRAGSPGPPRSLSSGSITTVASVAMSRTSNITDSIGTHPLLTCSQSKSQGSTTTTPISSMDLDFCHTPTSSTTDGSNSLDLSAFDKVRFSSALHIAARKGNVNIVRILLHHGVNCNEQDHENLTPIMHAIIEGHEEVVRAMLGQGATITVGDPSQPQSSALHLAVVHRREDILRTLLLYCVEKKISLDPYNEHGRTPLHEAIETENESAVVMLLHFGADPQSKTRNTERQRYTDFDLSANDR